MGGLFQAYAIINVWWIVLDSRLRGNDKGRENDKRLNYRLCGNDKGRENDKRNKRQIELAHFDKLEKDVLKIINIWEENIKYNL